jgi:hypothetical protein
MKAPDAAGSSPRNQTIMLMQDAQMRDQRVD